MWAAAIVQRSVRRRQVMRRPPTPDLWAGAAARRPVYGRPISRRLLAVIRRSIGPARWVDTVPVRQHPRAALQDVRLRRRDARLRRPEDAGTLAAGPRHGPLAEEVHRTSAVVEAAEAVRRTLAEAAAVVAAEPRTVAVAEGHTTKLATNAMMGMAVRGDSRGRSFLAGLDGLSGEGFGERGEALDAERFGAGLRIDAG